MAAVKLKRYFVFSLAEKNRINGVCQLCHRNYRDLNGIYSNFIKHLKRKHPSEHNKAFKQPDDEDSMDDIDSDVDDAISVDDPSQVNSKQTRIILSMAKNVIVKCNLPFSIAENPAFQEFLKDCYPKWHPISSRKLKSNVIPLLKDRIDKIIYDALEKVDYLTLTIDAWSDRRGRGFLGVTCHFIDEKMASRAFLIDFVRMKSPHTSETIQQLTECILDRLRIKHKVYRIITDNASTMVKAYKFGLVVDDEHHDRHLNHGNVNVDDGKPYRSFQCVSLVGYTLILDSFDSEQMCLDSFIQADVLITDRTYECKRLSCFAHTLQLAIRDGLGKDPSILRMMNKCKLFARLTHKTSKIADILDRINKHIERPNVTRWSSEFMLIRSILSIDKSDIESIGKSLDENIQFSSSEFKLMCEIVHVLEPFHLISTKCQSEKTVNISLVVPSIVHLWYHLQTTEEDLVFCRGLVQQLKFSLQGRFSGIIHRLYQTDVDPNEPFSDPLYFMAALLDPAFKFFWIKCLQLPVNAENRLKHHIIQLVLDDIVRYDSQFSANEPNQSTHILQNLAARMSESGDTIRRIRLFQYDDFFYENTSTGNSDHLDPSVEVDAYINDPIRATFSDYWCRSHLTSLKKLARRIFSVQASSAPIERVFSQAGLIFSTRRTRMNEQLFRDTIFLKANQSLL